MSPSPDKFMEDYRVLYGDRASIFWLFHDRCIICNQKAEEVNEILPRARSKEATKVWRNQVTLCHFHHTEYHRNGVTLEKQREMLKKRREFLVAVGRESYI